MQVRSIEIGPFLLGAIVGDAERSSQGNSPQSSASRVGFSPTTSPARTLTRFAGRWTLGVVRPTTQAEVRVGHNEGH
jgi:hypothetical protein